MLTVKDVYDVLFAAAPAYMKEPWDNVGLLCGHMDREVTKVLIALDCTADVIEEAKIFGAQLIVTHHPLIFGELKAVNDQSVLGRNLMNLIESGIAAINLHTNLDCAPGGVNDLLAGKLGLTDVSVMEPAGTDAQGRDYGLIRMGYVNQTNLPEFAAFVKKTLQCPGLRFADGGKPVRRVAVGGGSCGSEIGAVLAHGCDTFVTADLKYHQFEEAKYMGLNLIDAGHFETENPVCSVLYDLLREKLPELKLKYSEVHKDQTQFL